MQIWSKEREPGDPRDKEIRDQTCDSAIATAVAGEWQIQSVVSGEQ